MCESENSKVCDVNIKELNERINKKIKSSCVPENESLNYSLLCTASLLY